MNSRFWIGIILIIFGFGFLLNQMNMLDFPAVLGQWWPVFVILIGVIQLANRTNSSVISGLIFIIVGGLFLINKWIDFDLVSMIWPMLIIVVGLAFIFSRDKASKPISSDNKINAMAIFSSTELSSQAIDFEGGSITTIFGGADIDLRDAMMIETGATIEVTVIFGGVTIRVPDNVQVEMSGLPIFGGWENNIRNRRDNDLYLPKLHIKCISVFGGVEVKD